MNHSSPVRCLIDEYRMKKKDIRSRLSDFDRMSRSSDEILFGELCFCLLTPQSKAVLCAEAIGSLKRSGHLLAGREEEIRGHLKGKSRFHNKKASYIVQARETLLRSGEVSLKSLLRSGDPFQMREWLTGHIKGLGYKEASHFLRNVGHGKDLAILDRHILKNLKLCGAIDALPSSLGSKKTYLEIEARTRAFAEKIKISLGELDLLFWSRETGIIFK